MRSRVKSLLAAALLVAVAPLLAACSTGDATESADSTSASAELTLSDGWAKAATIDGMTGVFGTLHNHGDIDIVLTRVESDAAGMVELHEVTDAGVMQEIADDVVVPAGGSFELVPGGNHIMLMALQADLLAGDDVGFTVFYTADGVDLTAPFSVLVKEYSGANEDYAPGDDEHGSH